ncbi:MAG: aminoglycoside 6-adenylyltransferase [Oscillospiraceae bacterium]|jgi:aminoglycoside 6-adenylyltransferase|nr:aminoglycoside 6-adenylyltransferase [Oscillospiraceae bacterium]
MRTEEVMMDLILGIAKADERVRAVSMEGSRANPQVSKDQYQDYDITIMLQILRRFTTIPNG